MTVGKKFAYADDLAILHYARNWTAGIKENSYSGHGNPILLPLQMEAQTQYSKDCVGTFPSLQRLEARHELNIFVNEQVLPFCAKPTYFGTKLIEQSRFADTYSHCTRS